MGQPLAARRRSRPADRHGGCGARAAAAWHAAVCGAIEQDGRGAAQGRGDHCQQGQAAAEDAGRCAGTAAQNHGRGKGRRRRDADAGAAGQARDRDCRYGCPRADGDHDGGAGDGPAGDQCAGRTGPGRRQADGGRADAGTGRGRPDGRSGPQYQRHGGGRRGVAEWRLAAAERRQLPEVRREPGQGGEG